MKVLICGFGEVGKSITRLVKNAGHEVQLLDPALGLKVSEYEFKEPPPVRVSTKFMEKPSSEMVLYQPDVVHICFPFIEFTQFAGEVMAIANTFNPKTLIINSTIPLDFNIEGETLILHNPVRGTHPDIYAGLCKYMNFVAPFDLKRKLEAETFCKKYYWDLARKNKGYEWTLLRSAKETALGKLINTTWYLMEIAFANEIQKICDEQGIMFEQSYVAFQETDEIGADYYNHGFNENGRTHSQKKIPRPIMRPGYPGGHCLIPNLGLFQELNALLKTWFFEKIGWAKGRWSK